MANVGLSKPYYAIYTEENGSVTYSDGGVLGRATSVELSLDNADPTILYADNGPAERASLFSGGTVTIGIDELNLNVAAAVLGLEPPSGTHIEFTADSIAPYVGLGFVTKKIYRGVTKYRAVVLYKAQFQIPGFSISTQGESIEFETPELEAAIMRDDTTAGKWSSWDDFDTEALAEAFVKNALSIGG